MTEVRETIRRVEFLTSIVVNSSVMPSAKYSWPGSPDRFSRGSTAREPIAGWRAKKRVDAAITARATPTRPASAHQMRILANQEAFAGGEEENGRAISGLGSAAGASPFSL